MTSDPIFAAACSLLIVGGSIVAAQAPASAPAPSDRGAVIGTGTFTGFVENR